jgi:hypothetical protein
MEFYPYILPETVRTPRFTPPPLTIPEEYAISDFDMRMATGEFTRWKRAENLLNAVYDQTDGHTGFFVIVEGYVVEDGEFAGELYDVYLEGTDEALEELRTVVNQLKELDRLP